MGCDIHFHVEKKAKNGRWVRAEKEIDNPYYDPDEDPDWREPKKTYERWYDGRNYALFGVLAGVRSWHTDAPYMIAGPRGLPEAPSASVQAEYRRWEGDAHSMSYFTLEELTEHDWHTPKIPIGGLLNPANFYEYITTGKPTDWYEPDFIERAGQLGKIVPMHQMKPHLDKLLRQVQQNPKVKEDHVIRGIERLLWELDLKTIDPANRLYTPFEATVSLAQWIHADHPNGFMATINLMHLLCDKEFDGDRTKIRAVFWFDN